MITSQGIIDTFFIAVSSVMAIDTCDRDRRDPPLQNCMTPGRRGVDHFTHYIHIMFSLKSKTTEQLYALQTTGPICRQVCAVQLT